MCLVSEQLREAVKQRLAAAADEIFELLEKTISEYKEETQRQRHTLEQLLSTRGQGLKTESEEEVKTEETWTPLLPHNHTQNQTPQLHHNHTLDQTHTYSQNHSHNQTQDWHEATHNQSHNQNHSHTHNQPHSRPLDSTLHCQSLEHQSPPWLEAATPLSPPGGALRHFCSICTKGFRAEWQLKRHIRVHTGERPFSCSVCGRSFSRKDALQGHVAIHTGRTLGGTKTCQICGKTFRSGNHLRRHMTVHTGEKPFSCSMCGRSFSRTESLRKHMDAHTVGGESCTSHQLPGGSKTQPRSALSPHHTHHTIHPTDCMKKWSDELNQV